MSRRAGVTLVEVLVAIFVMGIGLIALLTLFPIGMLRMARAIHDERSRQAGLNADATAIAYDLRSSDIDVVTAVGGTRAAGYDYVGAPVNNTDMFANPWPAAGGLKAADPYGESYSILVDPIGYYNVPNGVARHWVAGSQGVLRRRPVEFVRRGLVAPPPVAVQRRLRISKAFTLWDDMVFHSSTATGSPGTPQAIGGTVLREPRYSWAYTMRRPQTSDRSVVDCSIVIFDKRSLSITGNGVLSEYAYQNVTYFNPTNNTITIDYSGVGVVPPPVRSGDWILDATRTNPTPTTGSSHSFWYRIVASEEFVILGKNYVRFEVQQPIRGFSAPPTVADPLGSGNAVYQGTAVILDGVADVFDKGPARLPQ